LIIKEAILSLLGMKEKSIKSIQSKYCIACKKAKKDNCERCTKKIEVLD
jgi:hypothetical protein